MTQLGIFHFDVRFYIHFLACILYALAKSVDKYTRPAEEN